MAVLKLIVFVAIPLAISIYCFTNSGNEEIPKIEDGWWGRDSDAAAAVDRPPAPFAVKASNATLADLRSRLENTRFPSSLDGTAFEYGLNSDYLRKVVSYWKDTFNWDAQQAKLNAFPQFKVKIEGIDVHFVRIQPKKPSNSANEKRRAIMLIHGWPGSYWEFYKLIPLLMETKSGDRTNEKESISFEIICPSIPGYGFSEAPHKPGFDALDAARVFMKLMKKLGHDKFYVQGGDWGSAISILMAQAYPENIIGVHLNLAFLSMRKPSLGTFVRLLIGEIWPSLIHSPAEIKIRPSLKQLFFNSVRESGYLHLQATKPDTIAAGLNDSPAGLAAYILEKFSSWSNFDNVHCPDGCFTKHFTMDEVLTNVMIYWLAGNIGSSMRFYKEYFTSDDVVPWDSLPVVVPSGIAAFRYELVQHTRSIVELKFSNIVRYTDYARGGHFAALEVPELLAEDIKAFVRAVESSKP